MNRREFCRNIIGGAALLVLPLSAFAKETPEERVQRLIDATQRGGTLVIPYGTYRNPKWISRRDITLDLNGSTVISHGALYFVACGEAAPLDLGAITVMPNVSAMICNGIFKFSDK